MTGHLEPNIRHKMIRCVNDNHDIRSFMVDVFRDYINRSASFRQSVEGGRLDWTEWEYVENDYSFYSTQPYFTITIMHKSTKEMHHITCPSSILNTTNQGWCRDWRILFSVFVYDQDVSKGLIPRMLPRDS